MVVYYLFMEWTKIHLLPRTSNFKIVTKNDASVNCDFDVTTLVFQSLKGSELEYDIRKTFVIGMESELNLPQ